MFNCIWMLPFDIFMFFFNSPIPDGVTLKLPILHNLHMIFSNVSLHKHDFTLKNDLKNILK